MSPALAGVLAGMMHVASGPDHLVAVAPLAIRKPGLGFRIGTAWGLGHATGALSLGMLGVLGRAFIDIGRLSRWSEVLVGGVLIAIGIWSLLQSRNVVLHRHPHAHGSPSAQHEHLHVHGTDEPHTRLAHKHHKRSAFAVGVLHGAAGTGHLLAVIPALALSASDGISYLIGYGLAAVLAMAAFGALMGLIGHRLSPKWLQRGMQTLGGAAIVLGVFWVATGWPEATRVLAS
jgi:hypothetical protein